jgi:APA family basic amino acid/polyamine antiporter
LLATFGLYLPDALASAPLAYSDGEIVRTGGLINLPAVLISLAVASLCYVGIRQSASANAFIVAIKVVVILMFIGFGLQHVDPANWQPLIPPNEGGDRFGVMGVLRGASIVFFAYIGFDAVSTAAQEAKNPQRDMPIGIIGSLVICTILYIIVSAVMTGMIPYAQLNTAEPVATALSPFPDLLWLKTIVQIGAVAGLSSVILVLMMGLPRILFAMARDGLLFKSLGDVHSRFRTPHKATIVVGLLASIIAALFPLGILGDLVSMGTLLAFATVCIGVLVLRYTRPDLVRPFKVPFAPVTCTLGALSCLSLVIFTVVQNPTNLKLIVGWTAFGFAIYFLYGYRHSKLRKQQA